MGEIINLPFYHTSDVDMLSALWNDLCDPDYLNTKNPSYDITLDPFVNIDELKPNNWDPNTCKYISLEELAKTNMYTKDLNITQLNVRSLKKNFEQVRTYVNTFTILPQIITLSETWLKDDEHELYN